MTKRGGKRPGAGRKKGSSTLLAIAMREKLSQMVSEEFGPVVKAQLKLAKGAYVMMVKNKKGEWKQITNPADVERLLNSDGEGENYYQIWLKNPSTEATKYLLDQALGKAKETSDVNLTGNVTFETVNYGNKKNQTTT